MASLAMIEDAAVASMARSKLALFDHYHFRKKMSRDQGQSLTLWFPQAQHAAAVVAVILRHLKIQMRDHICL